MHQIGRDTAEGDAATFQAAVCRGTESCDHMRSESRPETVQVSDSTAPVPGSTTRYWTECKPRSIDGTDAIAYLPLRPNGPPYSALCLMRAGGPPLLLLPMFSPQCEWRSGRVRSKAFAFTPDAS